MVWQRARSDEQKAQRRQMLLEAAARLHRHKPIEEVSLNAIAREANISKGNIYRYFESREELFLQLTLDAMQRWRDTLLGKLTGAADSEDAELLARAFTTAVIDTPRFARSRVGARHGARAQRLGGHGGAVQDRCARRGCVDRRGCDARVSALERRSRATARRAGILSDRGDVALGASAARGERSIEAARARSGVHRFRARFSARADNGDSRYRRVTASTMKRHPSMAMLARDHHHALVAGTAAETRCTGAAARIVAAWRRRPRRVRSRSLRAARSSRTSRSKSAFWFGAARSMVTLWADTR